MMMSATSPNPFPGIFKMAGVLMLTDGVWRIYPPAALIVAGLALLTLGFFGRDLGGGR